MEDNSLCKFADEINNLLPIIMREFTKRQAKELCKNKITFPQFFIIDYLYKQGPSTMTGLAKFMGITTAAMTGMVDRLIEPGYCQRIYDTYDRRIIRIKIAPSGKEIAKKVNQERRQTIINVFCQLSAKERREYLRILRHIYEIIISK